MSTAELSPQDKRDIFASISEDDLRQAVLGNNEVFRRLHPHVQKIINEVRGPMLPAAMAALAARASDTESAILWLGEQCYEFGGEPAWVSFNEHCVLQAFLKFPAMSIKALQRASGVEERQVRDVVRAIERRSPGAVNRPKKKSAGGYKLCVLSAVKTKTTAITS